MNLAPWFSFHGRIGRGRYWAFAVGLPLLVGAATGAGTVVAGLWLDQGQEAGSWVLLFALLAASLASGVASLSATVRRMHDLGRSGWWVLCNLIPLVNIGMLVWQGFYEGMNGPNAYGPDPQAGGSSAPGAGASGTDTGSSPSQDWLLVGVSGQYARCEFPLRQPVVLGTDARHASVVIDARRHPDIEPAHCQLRPPAGGEPATLWWPDANQRFERRDPHFDGREFEPGQGLRFRVQAAASAAGTP